MSKKFGSRAHENLGDGNKIATFPTSVQGAAAQLYLLATSQHYKHKLIAEAIATWSGGNHVNAYLAHIEKHTDLSRGDYIDDDLINDPSRFIALAEAMAWHETGKRYPMSKQEWTAAYEMFSNVLDGEKIQVVEKSGPQLEPLKWAIRHIGEKEIPGEEDNPIIVACFAEVGRPEIRDDETAWCAAFAGTALKRSGCAYIEGALTARSYLDYGIPLDEPEVGALCIMWRVRPDSWQGHVAFVESWTPTTVTLVGGNQDDSVSRITVPRTGAKSKVLGYRRAVPSLAPVGEVLATDDVKYKAGGLVAAVSASLWAAWEYVGGLLNVAYAYAAALWTDTPELATEVSSQVASFKTLSALSGLPWPAYLSLFIVIAALLSNFYETWKRMRNRQDPKTSAVRAG